MGLWQDIKWNLAHIFTTTGRQSPSQFWPYAGMVILLFMSLTAIAMVPEFLSTFQRMHQFALDHPDQATIMSGPGQYSIHIEGHHPELMPDFGSIALVMAVGIALSVGLIAAAAIRRLHDVGKSAAIGLPPMFFLGTGLYLMSKFLKASEAKFNLFPILLANNLLYLGALAFLVLQLVRAGDTGDNRFGPPPPPPWK